MSHFRMLVALVLVLIALVLVLIPAGMARAEERDLREQYGTKSLEAAKQIHQAIQLSEAKKPKDAFAAIEEAIKTDPKCQMAHFVKALVLGDLGDIEKSLEVYKTCLSEEVNRRADISATCANNLALTLAKLKEYDESCVWFTRAILEDSGNRFGQRGKAYRNLAITLRNQEKHFAAALAVAFAFEDKTPNTDLRMVRDFFDKAEGQEAATLLHFPDRLPKLEKRSQETKLTPVALEGGIPEPVMDLLPDPQGRYVIALPQKGAHYYVIATEDKASARKIGVAKPLRCACLVEEHLYGVPEDAPRIDKMEVGTGKVVESYSLKSYVPASIAVFPSQSRAYFSFERVVHEFHLTTGAVTKTNIPGQVVMGHPTQKYLYSYLKPEQRGMGGGHIIVNGRPIFFQTRDIDWIQTALFKAVVTPGGLLLAEVRDNAASNAARMSLSPDGNWVAVAGGGGWRPTTKQAAAGYGVAVFCAQKLEHVQGFFPTDAYPAGVCFSPVTGQVAALRASDAKVYHLTDPKSHVEVKGKFTGLGTWSGNGRYLVLASGEGGVSLFENTLSAEEQKLAAAWWKDIKIVSAAPKVSTTVFQAVEEYGRFALAAPSREELAKALAKAADTGRTEKPGRWQEYGPYLKDEAPRQAIQAAGPQLTQKEDLGIAIFQLKKALKNHPDSVPLQFVLAEAYRLGNQSEEAEKLYLAVVKADSGRTELSSLSLNHLATLLEARDKGLDALHCLAASLYLDKANPQTLAQTIPLLKKHKFEAEADKLAKLAATLPAVVSTELPALPKPGELKKLTAAEIYQKSVWSVVLIKTDKGTGSGVCVGKRDIILTNDHVVEGDGPIDVYPFIVKDKVPVRMEKVRATVIFRSPKEDLAVLRLEKAPDHLEPLPVATASPSAGEKVYAIGSPGLGRDVLEQSISEGLVSSNNRKIDGVPYLQHSAAVNPGNSGGPLLDEGGRVVGVVTLKTKLENVSFAIPVETIRTAFKSR